jgi:hypothetical protein
VAKERTAFVITSSAPAVYGRPPVDENPRLYRRIPLSYGSNTGICGEHVRERTAAFLRFLQNGASASFFLLGRPMNLSPIRSIKTKITSKSQLYPVFERINRLNHR